MAGAINIYHTLKYFRLIKTVYDFYSIMHYPKTTGCVKNTICIEIKEEYEVLLGDNVLEKYPVSLSLY